MKNVRKMELIPDRATRNRAAGRTRVMIAGMLAVSLALIASAGRSNAANESVIHAFTGGSDGAYPVSGLIVDKNGALYGTTAFGGGSGCQNNLGCGMAFTLTPPATTGGAWTETLIHSFAGGADGASPQAGLLAGKNGTLYGTTQNGGASNAGTVFKVKPPAAPGGAWTESVLYSFTGGTDGSQPVANLIADESGTLYSSTKLGGASGAGTVFALTPPNTIGGAWTESVLYSFTGGIDGSEPVAGGGSLVSNCTPDGCGSAFALTPPAIAGGAWTESILHTFYRNVNDGASPLAGLVTGKSGKLYGTTSSSALALGGNDTGGTVFALTPPATAGGAWTESLLHRFTFETGDGTFPAAGVVFGPKDHALYGTTQYGGMSGGSGAGTVFEVTP